MIDLNEHPAAKRMRMEFEAKHGEASNLMRAANRWFDVRTQYNDAWNRDRERPITLEDVEVAEREMLAARAQPAQAGQVLTGDEIDSIAKPFIRSVGDHWCNEPAIREQSVEDLARAIESAVIARVARVPQWLPIETAPKDWGVTKFDVWANDARFADCWWGKATYESGEPGIVYQSDYDCNGPVDSYVRNATHWMPLPPPPGIVGEKGGAT